MKIIPGGRSSNYLARVGIFLIITALITGIPVSYGVAGDDNQPSQNLEIYTWYDLDDVRDNLDGDHILMNDLNSTTPGYTSLASPTANGGEGWEPIGYRVSVTQCGGTYGVKEYGLSGTFDGQGYEIRDLFINRPHEMGAGLFAYINEGGIIKNVGVVNATVIGYNWVGSLVGSKIGGTISDCYSTGNVTGHAAIGGLAGRNLKGTISNSYSTGSVSGESSVGTGGLVGFNYDEGTVSNSYSNASVTRGSHTGGLVGLNGGNVNNCYSSGSITGDIAIGGLIGHHSDGTVNNSYSIGVVTGNSRFGGLVGESYAVVSHSFWDIETSGQSISGGGTGKNTTEMQDIATFSSRGWDIVAVANTTMRDTSYIWNIVNNVTYPFLSWQPVS